MAKEPRSVVVSKALTDPAFKAELLKDPKAAVEKVTGVKIPAGVSIKVVEDSASTVHLVLPSSSNKNTLSEAELARVTGAAGPSRVECAFNTDGAYFNPCTTVIVK